MTRFQRFEFEGGGLIVEENFLASKTRLKVAESFSVPEYIDGRPYCIPSSNQGNSPSCAGQATAGFIETVNWRVTGIQAQVDGLAIYNHAKEIDGSPSPGTTLTAAIQSAQDLGLLEKKKVRVIQDLKDVQFALHKFGVCIAGFMITRQWNLVDMESGFIHNGDASKLGGHAVLLCYYDPISIGWQNSWGEGWGIKGFARMSMQQFEEQFLYAVVLE